MPLSVGDKLGPYEILAPVGAGGMGEVYKARDTRLNRTVAIKRLMGQHTARFKQEALAIASLNHPNICTLHDIGPDYLVMEYVEGEELRGPLPIEDALRLAMQIAEALGAAHSKGILHRDLKPGNVLVNRSGAKLLDFGLAKLMVNAGTEYTQTIDGTVLGTAGYMSPEQAQGRTLDARSDIFSFGALLYEMLSGKRAFAGDSMLDTLNAVVREEPAPLQSAAADIVTRCMAKQPAQRFQSMEEVRAALQRVTAKPVEKHPSIAVLPFANMSRDADDEYFSDGLAEEIINLLANIPGLKVIARTSAFAFKGKNEDIRKIADTLGVSNVLEGSVRRAGNRLRITAQLIHAADGTHLWSQRYDRDMNDVFALQDEMSAAIAEQLKVRLIGAKRATTNVVAYEAYLEGRHHAQMFAPDALVKALECFQRAIALDPNYALAHVGMAEYYLVQATMGVTQPLQALPQLEAAARRALTLDSTSADAHAHLACARMSIDYDWAEAERLCQQALALNPTSLATTGAFATFYARAQGLPEQSLLWLNRTLELDPLHPLPRWSKGQALLCCRRYAEAEREFRRVLEIDPNHGGARFDLGPLLAMQGRFGEALAEAEEFVRRSGRWSMPLRTLAMVHALAGQSEAARSELAELHELEHQGYVPATFVAEVYAVLGEYEPAFAWASRAIEQRETLLLLRVRSSPLDLLRDDPRYAALLRKMKLA